MQLETIIGLEVHVQLKTATKMFCRCDNRDDQEPNTAICPVCTGQPGALPVANPQAIDWAVMTSLALGCSINQASKFDRKSYFYPDLPKGYQISQFDLPFGYAGHLDVTVDGRAHSFRIHRLHLEEDAGKLLHATDGSLVDLNRAGTPLMEIVSEPDFRSPAEAKAYVETMQQIVRYLGVSDADMEKGHLRCDANISLRPVGEEKLYPKTEVKNINSFRAIERALAYEIKRQTGLWEDGHPPSGGSTRGWDESTGTTTDQRTKEEAADYRYFPEPDLPAITITDEHLARLQGQIPELPAARRQRFMTMYSLNELAATGLVNDKRLSEYFEEVISEYRDYVDADQGADATASWWEGHKSTVAGSVANWLLNRISVEQRATHGLPGAADTARLLWFIDRGTVSLQAAVKVYDMMLTTKKGPHLLIQEMGLEQVSDTAALIKEIQTVIDAHPSVIADIRAGKVAAQQFLVGQVMKATKGKANPQVVKTELEKLLAA